MAMPKNKVILMVPMHANAIKLVLLVPPAAPEPGARSSGVPVASHAAQETHTSLAEIASTRGTQGSGCGLEDFKNSIIDILCPRSTSVPVKHIPIYCSYSQRYKSFWSETILETSMGRRQVWTQPPLEAHFYLCGASPAWQHSTKWPPSGVGT